MRFFLSGWVFLLLSIQHCYAQPLTGVDHLIQNGGYIVKYDGHYLQYREKQPFIPASTLKFITSLAALEILGKDYRFETHFSLDEKKNLYIKGFGDPFLTSEALRDIAKKLFSLGIQQIPTIFLDETSYALDSLADGTGNSPNPFDAPNGALGVNFNSVPVLISPDGTIRSGEPQTPQLALMHEIAENLAPGYHRLNINVMPEKNHLSPSLRYTGELFTALFKEAGITVRNGFDTAITPDNLRPAYIHISGKSLSEMIRSCLKYSNNYIANQLFLACGAASYGYPANWHKSRNFFRTYAGKRLNLSREGFIMVEGSGLSRKNRISPAGLLRVVENFRPYVHLLNNRENLFVKSGTLNGVFCYGGFFVHDNRFLPFVIMLNQEKNNRDKLIEALQQAIKGEMHD